MLCNSGFMDDVTFAHNGQKQLATQWRLSGELDGFNSVAYTQTDAPGQHPTGG